MRSLLTASLALVLQLPTSPTNLRLVSPPSAVPITRVQSASNLGSGFSDTLQVTLTSVTAGSLLVLWFNGSDGVTSVSDDRSNSWTLADGNTECRIYYVESAASGTTVITVDLVGVSLASMVAAEYSGIVTSSALDQSGIQTQTGTTSPATTTETTTQADELIVAAMGIDQFSSGVTITPNAGQTQIAEYEGALIKISADEKIVSSTGSYSLGWSLDTSSNTRTVIATFKGAGGGGVSIPVVQHYYRRRRAA